MSKKSVLLHLSAVKDYTAELERLVNESPADKPKIKKLAFALEDRVNDLANVASSWADD